MRLHVYGRAILKVNAIACIKMVMTTPSDISVRTWTLLIRAHNQALASVERTLKKNNLPPLIWYDILLELERVGDKGLRPFELERELLLPQYGVSRLIERIEKDGHLRRDVCEDDKRGQRLIITKSGKRLRQLMWRTYGPAIEDVIGRKLKSEQSETLSELLVKLTK